MAKVTSPNNNEQRETLVVNDIDRFYPPLADWIHDTYHFLPHWRMDDGQISLAEQSGGIGPHVDNYDVFLIQMSGTRAWQVGRKELSTKEEMDRMIEGLDVRVLENWGRGEEGKASEMEEWVLQPGDMLYLPPRVGEYAVASLDWTFLPFVAQLTFPFYTLAHCGTALSDGCMTLSVGCRAPSVSDLMSRLAENFSGSIEDYATRRYTDADLFENRNNNADSTNSVRSGELTATAKQRARELVLDSLTTMLNDDDWWDAFFGRYATEPKRVRNNYPIPLADEKAEEEEDDSDLFLDAKTTVESVLNNHAVLYHAEGIAFAHSTVVSVKDSKKTKHRLFANGNMWQDDSQTSDGGALSIAELFKVVANNRRLDRRALLDQYDEMDIKAIHLLEELVSIGVLYGAEE
jgi:ribosomal protein L16 Arg81 hydroxylase